MINKKRNRIASIFIGIVIALGIIGIIVLIRYSSRVISNDENRIGNTACNLYNGGTFCDDGERIYFSNLKDSGALYSMSKNMDDFKYVYEDTAGYINTTSAYIVYSRLNYTRSDSVKHVLQFSASGLYRMNKKDSHDIASLYYYNIGAAGLIGNDIFYQRLEKNGEMNLYRVLLNGKENEMLLRANVVPGTITKNAVYYAGTGENHYIYSYNPDSKVTTEIYKGNCFQPALIGSSIYFISLSANYNLAKVDDDGQNPTILVEDRCVSYNVTPDERYAVYQIDNGANNRLEMINLETMEKNVIKEGDYNSISIIGDVVFFREYATDEVYYFRLGAPDDVNIFNPPDLTENK